MELTESRDRWLKTKGDYERFNNNIDEEPPVQKHAATIPDLPAPISKKKNGLFLHLDTSDASWLIAGARKKYIPVGVSNTFEEATRCLTNLRMQKATGYVIMGDGNNLPFQQNLFDLIWGHAPRQFTSSREATLFAEKISHVLAKSGIAMIAFANKNSRAVEHSNGKVNGTNNHSAISFVHSKNEFQKHLTGVYSSAQRCLGVSIRNESSMAISNQKHGVTLAARTIAWCSQYIQPLNHFAESVYINARKNFGSPNFRIHHFMKHHWLRQNLNVVYLLECPISGGPVYLSKDSNFVISDLANVKYPVVNDIPVMLKAAAIELDSNKTPTDALRILQA